MAIRSKKRGDPQERTIDLTGGDFDELTHLLEKLREGNLSDSERTRLENLLRLARNEDLIL